MKTMMELVLHDKRKLRKVMTKAMKMKILSKNMTVMYLAQSLCVFMG